MTAVISRALGRFILRTPWSTSMAFVGGCLGVSSIVSVHLISASVADQLDELVPRQLAGYTHFLHADDLQAADYFKLRKVWRAGELPDVTAMGPLIDEPATLAGRNVRMVGVDLISDGYDYGSLGEASAQDFSWSGVWVDESLAGLNEQLGVHVNGTIRAPAGTVVGDIGTVQRLLGWSDQQISYVGINAVSGWEPTIGLADRLLPGFAAGLPGTNPGGGVLASWHVLALVDQHPASRFGQSVLFNISALSMLALLVAWFLIYQVAVSWLRHLWPVFERLHSAGVQWANLCGSFVVLMVILGGAAAATGVFAGAAMADLLYGWASIEGESQVPAVGLNQWVIGKGLVCGLVICGAGGGWAFRQSGRQSHRRGAWLALVATTILLAGYCVYSPGTGLLGGFIAIAALSLMTTIAVSPLLLRLRSLSRWLRGPLLWRLSMRESIWYPGELSVALGGLTLAVAAAVGISVMVDSFRSDFSTMLDRRLSYDISIEGGHAELTQLQEQLAAAGSVARLQSYRKSITRVQGVPVELNATRVDGFEAARYGWSRALAADEALLSEQGAQAMGVGPGDHLQVDGTRLRVVHVFASFGDLQPRVVIDQRNVLAASVRELSSLSVQALEAERLMMQMRIDTPGARISSTRELRAIALQVFDQTFAITTILIWLALLVAGLGIYTGVTAMRLNRRTGSRLLHALGLSRGEKFAMDGFLGLGLGAVATLLALPLGLAIAWLLCSVVNPRGFGWSVTMDPQLWAMLRPVLWGMLAAGAAGILRFGQAEEGVFGAAQ